MKQYFLFVIFLFNCGLFQIAQAGILRPIIEQKPVPIILDELTNLLSSVKEHYEIKEQQRVKRVQALKEFYNQLCANTLIAYNTCKHSFNNCTQWTQEQYKIKQEKKMEQTKVIEKFLNVSKKTFLDNWTDVKEKIFSSISLENGI